MIKPEDIDGDTFPNAYVDVWNNEHIIIDGYVSLTELKLLIQIIENQWTDNAPDKPGLYWYKDSSGSVDLIRIEERDGVFCYDETGEPLDSIIKNWVIAGWNGPVHPPKDQSSKVNEFKIYNDEKMTEEADIVVAGPAEETTVYLKIDPSAIRCPKCGGRDFTEESIHGGVTFICNDCDNSFNPLDGHFVNI